jgi:hypothetical protein
VLGLARFPILEGLLSSRLLPLSTVSLWLKRDPKARGVLRGRPVAQNGGMQDTIAKGELAINVG